MESLPSTSKRSCHSSQPFAAADMQLQQSAASLLKPPAIRLKPRHQYIKITCLFCLHTTLQPVQPEVEKDEEKEKRKLILRNLCDEMHLNTNEIPDVCLREMFPFCKRCLENVNRLWDIKKQMEQLQKSLVETIDVIQTVVRDRQLFEKEIKRPEDPMVVQAEARQFTKLRETILESYRKAILAEIVTNDLNNLPEEDAQEIVDVSATNANTTTATKGVLSVETNASVSRADDGNRPGSSSSTKSSTPKTPGSSSVPAASRPSSKNKTTTKKVQFHKQNLQSASNKRVFAGNKSGNGKRKRLTVTSRPTSSPTVVLNSLGGEVCLNVKKEPRATFSNDQNSIEWESDDEDIFAVAVGEGGMFFEGVQILRCVNPAKREYFQCTACNFTIPIVTRYKAGNGPYLRIRRHIANTHRSL